VPLALAFLLRKAPQVLNREYFLCRRLYFPKSDEEGNYLKYSPSDIGRKHSFKGKVLQSVA